MLTDLKISEAHELGVAGNADADARSFHLPVSDNDAGALDLLLAANAKARKEVWPEPFAETSHKLLLGDARDLFAIPAESIDLVVTSPPYWTLKEYDRSKNQLGAIKNYTSFLKQMDKVWLGLSRVLKPGGRICCVVGDVCISRKSGGRHHVIPLHADLQVRVQKAQLDCLTPILWHKITNAATEVSGNGAGFYGKPYQPGSVIKNDIEYILFFRKGGSYRSVGMLQKALSMIDKNEMQQ